MLMVVSLLEGAKALMEAVPTPVMMVLAPAGIVALAVVAAGIAAVAERLFPAGPRH